ncbi:MAG TPA: hypothetical protein VHA56_16145 [Mucilaginibacter sp.]|nr:hypothetical protein [Mucilaginibacter sp.]
MAKRQALRVIPKYDPGNNVGAVDRVKFCIINGRMSELTKAEIDQLERWKQIDVWIRQKRFSTVNTEGETIEDIITGHGQLRNLVMRYYGISWDTAERDIYNTKKFCAASYDDQEYYRSVYIEDAERMAQMAATAGRPDWRAAHKFLELAARLRGHFDEVIDETPYTKLENIQFFIEYNPEAVGLKTVQNKEELFAKWQRKRKSPSDLLAEDAEDVEYDF